MTRFAPWLGLLLLASGCDEKKTSPAPAVSSLAPSLPPPGGTSTKFTIDPESKTSIEMEAPKEKIKATATGGAGTLDVDLTNLTASRGEVKMDLTTLTTSTFPEEAKNKSQTTHARTWLEVADGEEGKVDDKVKEANRYAVYAIRAIDKVSANDVTKLPAEKDGSDDVRVVTLVTRGDLLVHGHKVEREAEVELKLHYPSGGDATKPSWIAIKSRKPFRVVLADHEVKPRDGLGKIAKQSFHLLGTKVADNADITLDLRAKAAP
ncbi:MAG: hypothetical protein KIT84_41150 [Labilithrix sp.]|nr:hypothetical protein [Labilithrix sp.]MCW5817479.1 hypothetical protein [Labilithrix sp.]